MRYVIIGNSAAGIGAAEAIREVDPGSQVTIISDEPEGAYSRALISYELAGWIPEGRLGLRPPEFYREKNIETLLGRRAVRIDPQAKELHLDNGQKVSYDKLLLATGGSPQKVGVKGEDKQGVFGFRTLGDLMAISAAVKNAREGVVLGGGCIGLQAACGLHHHGVETTIAVTSPHLLSQVADPECGDFFRKLFEKNGIAVRTNARPVEFKGTDRVESILFEDGSEQPAQLVVVGKGVKPNTDLAQGTKIRVDWGIVADETMRTDEPDIYAAGDVASTRDRVTDLMTVNAVWPCAYEQGRTAGLNMAGKHARYEGSLRMNAADFFGVSFISLGVVKPREEGYETHVYSPPGKNRYRKLIFKGERLVGAVLIGRVDHAGVLFNLMRKKADVSDIKDDLLEGRFEFARTASLVTSHPEIFNEREYRDIFLR